MCGACGGVLTDTTMVQVANGVYAWNNTTTRMAKHLERDHTLAINNLREANNLGPIQPRGSVTPGKARAPKAGNAEGGGGAAGGGGVAAFVAACVEQAAAGAGSPMDAGAAPARKRARKAAPGVQVGATAAEYAARKPLVLSSVGSSYLGDSVCAAINGERGNIERRKFNDGEAYYRLQVDDRYELVGRDVVYVASTEHDANFLELIRVGCALAAYGARRRIFVIPFLGYSTMERQVKPGEIITAKANARMLSAIPDTQLGNVFMLMDLHVQGLLQYFEGPCLKEELYAEASLIAGIKEHLDVSSIPIMFASADLGRPLWVQSFAGHFETPMAFVQKERTAAGTSVQNVIGDVRGRHVIIYDDMTRSGGTLINAAEAYLANGAVRVSAVLSHFALQDETAIERMITTPAISTCISTNTHPASQHPRVKASSKIIILDVGSTFAERISALTAR